MSRLMPRIKLGFSLLFLGAAGWGVWSALHADFFTLRIVEIVDLPETAPIDSVAIEKLARVPVGHANLLDLDLSPIEARLLKSPWIAAVRLQKRFPQTLAIAVELRDPVGMMTTHQGKLVYVDTEGTPFGKLDLRWKADLPVFSGTRGGGFPGFAFLEMVGAWGRAMTASAAQLSELRWDPELGVRALVRYGAGLHAWVELGEFGADLEGAEMQLRKLDQVLLYMAKNSIASTQVWADTEKKIVVKTAHGS